MKNSRQTPISSPAEDVEKNTSDSADTTILKNNPKIDHRLLAEYEHLISAAKGVIQVTQGADYNLAHPLSSKNKPTDAYHRGQRVHTDKKV
jgi:hypothetical protein